MTNKVADKHLKRIYNPKNDLLNYFCNCDDPRQGAEYNKAKEAETKAWLLNNNKRVK